jgi:hypothetical protein
MPATEVLAGNPARVTAVLTALDTPGSPPTAVVCITDRAGTVIETLTESIDVDANVITVTADWDVPDDQTGGIYVATIDTDGSAVCADEIFFLVKARQHIDPH